MADEVYATLDDLKKIYKPESWTPEMEEEASEKLASASAIIRQRFRIVGEDLNERLADGRLERIILRDKVCAITKRALVAPVSAFAGMDFESLTQSAGDYAATITQSSGTGGGKLYVHNNELTDLGLPTIFFGSMTITARSEYKEND